jgi:hypothetical protein
MIYDFRNKEDLNTMLLYKSALDWGSQIHTQAQAYCMVEQQYCPDHTLAGGYWSDCALVQTETAASSGGVLYPSSKHLQLFIQSPESHDKAVTQSKMTHLCVSTHLTVFPSDMFTSVAPIGSQGQAHHITPSTM